MDAKLFCVLRRPISSELHCGDGFTDLAGSLMLWNIRGNLIIFMA